MPAARPRFIVAALFATTVAGCALFQPPANDSASGSALSWLTQWTNQPPDLTPGFDVESLRPEARPVCVARNDLLEVTIWDLEEPGKPYTYPVRVSEQLTIAVPLVGDMAVAERTLAQVEADLTQAYRAGDYLVHPRVLVRSLDSATVKVQVKGAAARPGFVELSRGDACVYAALISTGGVDKSASTQVAVSRRVLAAAQPAAPRDIAAAQAPIAIAAARPVEHANSVEELSVDSGDAPPNAGPPIIAAATGGAVTRPEPPRFVPQVTWYDLSRPADREALRAIRLGEGDEVIVKAAAPPVRIGGAVLQPGAYPLPAGRSLNVWQALDLAGGVQLRDAPLHIALLRPASAGRSARRMMWPLARYDEHPAESPVVEPGDVLHVEPTTGTKIRRAVGDIWNKP
ncbi:MAG: polysaccharide biosynthesis/export family protein [Planctomycetaceae bacterium]